MPFFGTLDGETVIPEGVKNGTDVLCPECGEQMHPWGPSVDGRARHFQHYSDKECATAGGESATHRKLKSIAVSKLRTIFDDHAAVCEPEVTLDAPKSDAADRRADALVRFDERDTQLGNGLIIEVQYKNKGKDKRATERDYLAQDYSVVWVTPDDYKDNELTHTERSLRLSARHAAIKHFHSLIDIQTGYKRPIPRFLNLSLTESKVPAQLPDAYFDSKCIEIWRKQRWQSLFSPPKQNNAQIEKESVDVEIDIAPWLNEAFWKDAWQRGVHIELSSRSDIFFCGECDERITGTESFMFHCKREHKKKLKRTDSYRQLVNQGYTDDEQIWSLPA